MRTLPAHLRFAPADRIVLRRLWVTVLLLLAACGGGVPAPEQAPPASPAAQRPPVPATTPDSVPAWVYDHAHWEDSSPLWSGTFLRNVVLVVFERGTSQPQRQAAVDRISGEVVGGVRAFGDDGFYFVRIADDGTASPLLRAMELLDSLPQVSLATPEFIFDDMDTDRGGGAAPAATSLAGQQPPVPAEAPDTLPGWAFAEENVVPFLGAPEFRVVRNLVSVEFKMGTPQPERQAAIDLIGGEVIGGRGAPPNVAEGTYYVRIAGDSTGRAAVEAMDRLEALPQVSNASVVFLNKAADVRHWRRPVPPVPPDSVPEALWQALIADSNVVCNSPRMSGAFLRNLVVLIFKEGATQAERQAAVDMVGGEVVGGVRYSSTYGHYFVRIPHDGTEHPLLNSIDLLNTLPQVSSASAFIIVGDDLAHLRPQDGDAPGAPDRELAVAGAPMQEHHRRLPVPPAAPDTVPRWIYEPEHRVRTHPALPNYWILRNVIIVTFLPGTSQADRQAAIDRVGGEVIGGIPALGMSEGTYYVRIPGDSTGQAVRAAAKQVYALPQVRYAEVVDLADPADLQKSRLPSGGAGLTREPVPPLPPDSFPSRTTVRSGKCARGAGIDSGPLSSFGRHARP